MKKYSSGWRKVLLIIALLALNIVEQAGSVTSASIPQMAKSFPQISEVSIELVTTIVSIFVTIFVLISGFMTKKFGQKNIAITGLLIASVSSIIPAFSNDFTLIMWSRAILGVGIGLANPLAISLIGEFFSGDTLANLMGWRSAVASVGGAVMTFIAGQFLLISWHASYLVYLLFIPTLLLFIFFVPSPEKHGIKKETKEDTTVKSKKSESKHSIWPIIALSMLLFIYCACAMVLGLKMAKFFIDAGLGSPTDASTVLSVFGLAQLAGGALFGVVYKFLKKATFPLGLMVSSFGIVGIALSKSMLMVLVCGVLAGAFGGLAVPYIFTKVAQLSNTKEAPLNNAIILVGSNLGTFLSPYVGKLLGSTSKLSIQNAGIVLVIVSIIIIAVMVTKNLKAKKDKSMVMKNQVVHQ